MSMCFSRSLPRFETKKQKTCSLDDLLSSSSSSDGGGVVVVVLIVEVGAISLE